MGCGSSSLKGDAATGVDGPANDPPPRPLQKVATNFSTVNYDNTTQNRRATEYAPHETEAQPTTIDEAVEHANAGVDTSDDTNNGVGGAVGSGSMAAKSIEGEKLAPYKTIEGDEFMDASEMPVTNGVKDVTDPTSSTAKDEFAAANDPANPSHQHHGQQLNGASAAAITTTSTATSGLSPSNSADGKKADSWLGKKYKVYADARDGKNKSISDEDLKKYTGKTRQEVDELREKGDGVGARQPVDYTKGFSGSAAIGGGL